MTSAERAELSEDVDEQQAIFHVLVSGLSPTCQRALWVSWAEDGRRMGFLFRPEPSRLAWGPRKPPAPVAVSAPLYHRAPMHHPAPTSAPSRRVPGYVLAALAAALVYVAGTFGYLAYRGLL